MIAEPPYFEILNTDKENALFTLLDSSELDWNNDGQTTEVQKKTFDTKFSKTQSCSNYTHINTFTLANKFR